MEDPGPNVLEQQIETNRLLALILAASGDGAPSGASYPGASGGARCQWPTLFAWSNGTVHPFNVSGDDGYAVAAVTANAQHLSHDTAIKIDVPAGTGKAARLAIQPPMGPSLAPWLQFAWMTKQWPTACRIIAELWYDNGTNLLKAGIQLDEATYTLAYRNSAGIYTTIGTNIFDYYSKDWKKLDLCVNFADSLYSWAGCNADGYDLSAQALQSAASSTKKRLYLTLEVINSNASVAIEGYLDEILLTDELYTGPE